MRIKAYEPERGLRSAPFAMESIAGELLEKIDSTFVSKAQRKQSKYTLNFRDF